jgi:RNA polymerase sigma-70 factor, ECF subfamily
MPAVTGTGASQGDASPPSDVAAAVYAHLRAIAARQMAQERPGHTLTATALVHEAYLRLADVGPTMERGAFVRVAAEAMRRILIDHARARRRVKRGEGAPKASLDAIGDVADLAVLNDPEQTLALDDAFRRLEEQAPRQAEVARLRFFAGLSVPETASTLGISERSVNNDWTYARAWLARELQNGQWGG